MNKEPRWQEPMEWMSIGMLIMTIIVAIGF